MPREQLRLNERQYAPFAFLTEKRVYHRLLLALLPRVRNFFRASSVISTAPFSFSTKSSADICRRLSARAQICHRRRSETPPSCRARAIFSPVCPCASHRRTDRDPLMKARTHIRSQRSNNKTKASRSRIARRTLYSRSEPEHRPVLKYHLVEHRKIAARVHPLKSLSSSASPAARIFSSESPR